MSIHLIITITLDRNCQIQLKYRFDRNLFDYKKLKVKTKVSRTELLEIQYADDCALVADSLD